MNRKLLLVLVLVTLALGVSVMMVNAQGPHPGSRAPSASSLGTGFTYQGQLKQSGSLVNASCDFVFNLWDSSISGNQVGATITQTTVPITNGLFTTVLDFGDDKFVYDARWLATSVRCPAGSGGYNGLTPRQKLTPAPFALALPGFYTRQNPNSPSIIGGHVSNTVVSDVFGGTIGGGGSLTYHNLVTDDYGTVGGGYGNQAGDNTGTHFDASLATVGGGQGNTASGPHSTVGGGYQNIAAGDKSTVPGGYQNEANGARSFAIGTQAKAQNQGAFVWADSQFANFSSTASDQFLIRASGGVGMGTNSPDTQLHVVKSIDGNATPGNHVAIIENSANGSNADGLAIKIGYTSNPTVSNNFITFFRGGDVAVGAIEGNGSGGIQLISGGADYAEYLPRVNANELLAPGDIVGLSNGHISKSTRGATQWMVISSSPIVVGNDPGEGKHARYDKVAFMGQAPVRVRGTVRAGDFIVPSGLNDGSGVAVAIDEMTTELAAQIVGRALENSNTGAVNTLVGVPRDEVWAELLAQKESQIVALQKQNASMESRLSALEQREVQPRTNDWAMTLGLLSGALGITAYQRTRKGGTQ